MQKFRFLPRAVLAAACALPLAAAHAQVSSQGPDFPRQETPGRGTSDPLPQEGQRTALPLNKTDARFLQAAAAGLAFDAASVRQVREHEPDGAFKAYADKVEEDLEHILPVLKKLAADKKISLSENLTGAQRKALDSLPASGGEAWRKRFVQISTDHQFQMREAFKKSTRQAVDQDVRGFARTYVERIHQHLVMINSLAQEHDPSASRPSHNTGPARGAHLPDDHHDPKKQ